MLSQAGAVYAQGTIQEFLEASRGWLPDSPLIAIREATGEWAGIVTVGYDPVSGAWFHVSESQAGGRTPSGKAYYAKPEDTSLGRPVYDPLPSQIGTLMPAAILGAMHERPATIRDAKLDEAAWSVVYRVVTNTTANPPRYIDCLATFDAKTGRMISHQRENAKDLMLVEFDWSDPDIDQVKHTGDGPRFRVRLEDDVDLGDFELEAVLSRMRASAIATEQRLAAMAAGYKEDSSGRWSPPNPEDQELVPYDHAVAEKWRTPLILGGGIILLIGVVEAVRRRKAMG